MKALFASMALVVAVTWPFAAVPVRRIEVLRGKPQQLRLFGDPRHEPVLVASGDGGWLHLAPHVAQVLTARGFYVVGFDAKAYLDSFTERAHTLRVEDVPGDFSELVGLASRDNHGKPVLVGVSEGAGLSVLAAASNAVKPLVRGVIGIGLGDRNELGWRWKDSIIYFTKRVPDEPTFSAAQFIPLIRPVPVALLRSSHDEFVAPAEAQLLADCARDPKRVWTIDAADHRFSNNLPEFDARLLEAMEWIRASSR